MKSTITHLAAALACVVAARLDAQVRPGVFGYQVVSSTGIAGEFCLQFDCTPRASTCTAGETLTLRVNAPHNNLFAIGASLSATSCLSIPGIGNMLVIDPPIVTIAVGIVANVNPALACWGGTVQVPLTVPAGVPHGLSFASQALADVPGLNGTAPSFSVAVITTIL
jgi:hypothetical protein